jgi:hypothetical protein
MLMNNNGYSDLRSNQLEPNGSKRRNQFLFMYADLFHSERFFSVGILSFIDFRSAY